MNGMEFLCFKILFKKRFRGRPRRRGIVVLVGPGRELLFSFPFHDFDFFVRVPLKLNC